MFWNGHKIFGWTISMVGGGGDGGIDGGGTYCLLILYLTLTDDAID